MVDLYTTAPVPLGEHVPSADQRIVLRNMTWSSFQMLLAVRGERRWPRMAYLDGAVELMGASRAHERIKSGIHEIIAFFCLDRGIECRCFGSYLLDDASVEAGAEPDDCYLFVHDVETREPPDLVVEVVWTSGGLNKLKLYQRLGIPEVWFWRRGAISVHVLGPNGYTVEERSTCLPDLDLALVCDALQAPSTNDMIARMRAGR